MNSSNKSESNIPTENSSVLRLAQGEVTKRDVTLTSAKGPFGRIDSRIVITDARVIYIAEARNKLGYSRAASEIQLNDVGSISHYVNRGLSGFALVAVPLLVLFGFLFLLANFVISVLFLVIAAIVVAAGCRNKRLGLQ